MLGTGTMQPPPRSMRTYKVVTSVQSRTPLAGRVPSRFSRLNGAATSPLVDALAPPALEDEEASSSFCGQEGALRGSCRRRDVIGASAKHAVPQRGMLLCKLIVTAYLAAA